VAFRIQTVQLTIEKAVYGGDGLARLPADEHGKGKSVFVPFVLEGERVEAAVTEQKPGFARAQLEAVLDPSPARVSPQCPYFQRCGGCHYQHSSYEHQLKMKATILRETLHRSGKIELPCELRVRHSPPWNYRNRTRLKVQAAPEFALGYYRFRTHDFQSVEQCPISSPLINRAIGEISVFGRNEQLPAELREIELFANSSDDTLLVEAYCAPGSSRRDARGLAEKLINAMPEITGVAVFEQTTPHQNSEPRHLANFGESHIAYQTSKISYRVSAGSFFQVNRFLIDELVDIVTAGSTGKVALDLYAGVGLFSVMLARSFAQVIAVEASQTSYSDLRDNAPQEVKAVRATTERYLEGASERPDFVVADPPRGGLGERNVRNLVKLGAARVTYVSCDPSTLARDLRAFVSRGYRIDGADLIDLFPQTFHIESVFRLAL
jgi:23S rRNA (uracil1939-C5)-methyltransferase